MQKSKQIDNSRIAFSNRLIFPKSLVNSQIAFSNRLCFLNRSKQALLQATALNRSNRMFFAESLESPKTSNSILKSRHQNSNPAFQHAKSGRVTPSRLREIAMKLNKKSVFFRKILFIWHVFF